MLKEKQILGSAETIVLPSISPKVIHARIDSGARTSAIWGRARVGEDHKLYVAFFEEAVEHKFDAYSQQVVATSMGHIDTRYTIKTVVKLKGRRIRATFTIADRSTQVYPVLIGRNVLRGKFVVDVQFGKSLKAKEKKRISDLQETLGNEKRVL